MDRSEFTRILLDIFIGENRIHGACTIDKNILKAMLDYKDISMLIFNLKRKNKPAPVIVKKVLLVLIAAGILGYSTKNTNTSAEKVDKSVSKDKPIEGRLVFTCNINGELTSTMAINDDRYWIRIKQILQ